MLITAAPYYLSYFSDEFSNKSDLPVALIYDLPPALVSDDVVAMIPHIDAVLLVVDGTRSTAADIKATERLFDGKVPLMGVVLNKAQDRGLGRYAYGKR